MLEKRDSFAENGKCICTLGAATFNLQISSKIFGFKIDFRKIHVYQLISSHWSVADGRVFINCGGRSVGKERVVKQRELTFLHCLKCKIEKNICLIFE